jgi:hypothetical protein
VAVATPSSISTGATSTLSTTGGSGTGAVSYAVASGACTVSGSTLTAPAAAGACTVTATKAADATYAAATSAATSVTVTAPLIVVQSQTATQDSYVPSGGSLPGNNTAGSYDFGVTGGGWWSGVGADSVYRGVGVTVTDTGGVGVYVAGAGTTTWSISGRTAVVVGLGTNAECVGVCKATLILKTAACTATNNTPITILTEKVNTGTSATLVSGAKPTYTAALTDAAWTVTGCATNTMTYFKTQALTEVHAQIVKANMQTATPAATDPKFPNGINLGAIMFQ